MVNLDFLSLVWNQSRFVEAFGSEKVMLNAAFTSFDGTSSSIPEVSFDTTFVFAPTKKKLTRMEK